MQACIHTSFFVNLKKSSKKIKELLLKIFHQSEYEKIKYKVKNDESTDRLYLYKNDVYQGAIHFLDLFE